MNSDHKEIFWGNSKDGAINGAINKAPHKGTKGNVTTISKIDNINAIVYEEDEEVNYFISNKNTVYVNDIPKNKTTLVN